MATDIIAIIGHNLTPFEIANLPKQIDSQIELKDIYINNYRNKAEFGYKQQQIKEISLPKSNWTYEFSESNLVNCWTHNENLPVDYPMYNEIQLETYFGWLTINRHTIQIKLFPEHKYANFFYFNQCKYILFFNRALAKKIGQDKIIYTADNGHGFEDLQKKAIEGEKFDELLKHCEETFGTDSNSIVEKIKNMFFIDNISNDIEYFEDLSWKDIEN